jgi:hypothetical protein
MEYSDAVNRRTDNTTAKKKKKKKKKTKKKKKKKNPEKINNGSQITIQKNNDCTTVNPDVLLGQAIPLSNSGAC